MRSLTFLGLGVVLFACGGATTGSSADSDGGNRADAALSHGDDDARGADADDETSSWYDAPSDVPSDDWVGDAVSNGRVPKQHRPDGSACPQQRGPGMLQSGCDYDAGFGGVACTRDSQCTMGTNGRCLTPQYVPLPCSTACSYDECFADSDCKGNVPCICRASATDFTANVCMSGSNCRVDADCGAGGYCSPSAVAGCGSAYFCHTPGDTCVDDSDCATQGGWCNYDPMTTHWKCGGTLCIPPP
jgi:hypothetical protein